MHSESWLTTGNVMAYCCKSRPAVLEWIKSKKLMANLHPDGEYRITQSAFIDLLKSHNMPVDKEMIKKIGELNECIAGLDRQRKWDAIGIRVNSNLSDCFDSEFEPATPVCMIGS